jgi:hypothetical protein
MVIDFCESGDRPIEIIPTGGDRPQPALPRSDDVIGALTTLFVHFPIPDEPAGDFFVFVAAYLLDALAPSFRLLFTTAVTFSDTFRSIADRFWRYALLPYESMRILFISGDGTMLEVTDLAETLQSRGLGLGSIVILQPSDPALLRYRLPLPTMHFEADYLASTALENETLEEYLALRSQTQSIVVRHDNRPCELSFPRTLDFGRFCDFASKLFMKDNVFFYMPLAPVPLRASKSTLFADVFGGVTEVDMVSLPGMAPSCLNGTVRLTIDAGDHQYTQIFPGRMKVSELIEHAQKNWFGGVLGEYVATQLTTQTVIDENEVLANLTNPIRIDPIREDER